MNGIEVYIICDVWCQGEYVNNVGYMMFNGSKMMSDVTDKRDNWMNDKWLMLWLNDKWSRSKKEEYFRNIKVVCV